jgi:AcrR family transcriptional regulator
MITFCHLTFLWEIWVLKQSSRERLFREAIRIFGERGYHETTIGDIEEAAGLTRRAGGFYRHFKSKEVLVVEAIERMSAEMIADIRLDEVVSLKSPRAEMLVIARALLRHAQVFRPLRILMQREVHRSPVLRKAARKANEKLAKLDVVPWVKNVLKRSGITGINPQTYSLLIFGPVTVTIVALDRGEPAYGVETETFLDAWADHWAQWLEEHRK